MRAAALAPAAVAALTAALVAGACGGRYGAPEPATRQGEDILGLWRILFWAGAGVGTVVAGLVLWSVVRYRRRPGGAAGAFHENVRLEVAWTLLPLAIVAALLTASLLTQRSVTRLTPDPDVRVEVTGFQWGWRFHYLTEGVTLIGTSEDPPTLFLPLGQTTRLILLSPDVVHSFYVPAFLVKRDLVPGVDNRMDLSPNRAGRFGGVCAEFCGLDHGRMTFVVEVLEPVEFQRRLAEEQEEQPGRPTPEAPQGNQADPGRQAAPARPPTRSLSGSEVRVQ